MLILLRRDGVYYMPERVVVRKHEKVEYANNSFFTFSHNYYNQDYCFESHWHNSIEITYVVKGEKIQRMENEEIVAKTGTLLLVNSGVSHDIDVKKGIEGIVLLIDRKFINHVCPNAIGKRFDLEKNLEVKQKIINILLKIYRNESQENNLIDTYIDILIIVDLLTKYLIDDKYYIQEKHDDELYELVIEVINYIDKNYKQKISLNELAALTNYNKSYLSTVFKKKMGISIFEYIKNVRIQHCLDDLKYSDESIVDIALNNGFPNIQAFNRTFKELFKMTPKQYRKKTRK